MTNDSFRANTLIDALMGSRTFRVPMLASPSLDPSFAACALAALILGVVAMLIGRALVTSRMVNDQGLLHHAIALIAGLLFITGMMATVLLRRPCYYTLMPVLLIGWRLVWARWSPPASSIEAPREPWPRIVVPLLIVAAVVFGFEWWFESWMQGDGSVRKIHSDLGFYVQALKGLPEARLANSWAATLGVHASDNLDLRDFWYHWGPIWLGSAIASTTSIAPIAALLIIVPAIIDLAMVLAAGSIVQRLTRWPVAVCLIVGLASLAAVQLTKAIAVLSLGDVLHFETIQHFRTTLAEAFAYKFEAMLMLGAMAAWLWQRSALAVLLLFLTGVSAPHNVGILGVTAGVLGTLGLVLRQRPLWQTAGIAIATLISAWISVKLCGAGLPKAEGQSMLALDPSSLLKAIGDTLPDIALGLLAAALTLPGLVHLIRNRDEQSSDETRILGWLPFCAIVGGFAAYHLFGTMSDRFHFTALTHAMLVLPVGIWAMARLAAVASPLPRLLALVVIVLDVVLGIGDLRAARSREPEQSWQRADLAVIQSQLKGRPFGYFATTDREWWIPEQSSLAAVLDSRCIRLNEIDLVDKHGTFSKYYGADIPHRLVPTLPGESADAWSLRFAQRLGIACVIELQPGTLPAAIKAQCHPLASAGGMTLFEIKATSPGPMIAE